MKKMAALEFKYSVMNAGKTNQLLALAQSLKDCGENPLLISSAMDDRFGESVIASRSGWAMPCIAITSEINLLELVQSQLNKDQKLRNVILDEVQFYTPEQIIQLAEVVDTLNINVTCFGLNIDSNGNMFEASKKLIELADSSERIGVKHCHCGKRATMILRFDSQTKEILKNVESIMVGKEDSYSSVCRKCWTENNLPETI